MKIDKFALKLPRYTRPKSMYAPSGVKVGQEFNLETFGGNGIARYEGNCWGCGRHLFQDVTEPRQTLTLGVHVSCAYDEFPDVPLCFECHAERKLYDALCAARKALSAL